MLRKRPILLAIARQRAPWHLAVEIAQNTFHDFFQQVERGAQIENPNAYLLKILHRKITKAVKDVQQEQQNLPLDGVLLLADSGGNPESEFLGKEERDRIRRCFAALDSKCRKLLFLKIIEGKTYDEIEPDFPESRATLQRHCLKCLEKFAEYLRNFETGK